MTKRYTLLFLFLSFQVTAQVGVNTVSPNSSAALDIVATDKGVLVPRMDSASRAGIGSPATGLLVYQTNGATPGFYYNSGTTAIPSWTRLNTGTQWSVTGNAATSPATNYLGTSDATALSLRTAGTERIRISATGEAGINTSTIPANTQVAVSSGSTSNYQFRLLNSVTGNTSSDGFGIGQANGAGEMIFNQFEGSGVYFQYQGANTFQYNGAGIGVKTSTTPTEALEVNGNVELQAAANDYKYATARTRYLNLHGSAFEPYTTTGNSAAVVTQAFASGSSRSISGGTSGTDYMMIAPVILPNGAVITGIEVYAWDNSNVYEVTGELCRETLGGTSVTLLASITTGLVAVNASMALYSSSLSTTVDNTNYVYLFRVKMEEGLTTATDLRLGYVRIIYTVTKAE